MAARNRTREEQHRSRTLKDNSSRNEHTTTTATPSYSPTSSPEPRRTGSSDYPPRPWKDGQDWAASATPSIDALRTGWAAFQVSHYLQSQDTALLHRTSSPLSTGDVAMLVETIGAEDPLWCLRLLEVGASDAPNNPRAVARRYLATLAYLTLSDQPLTKARKRDEISSLRAFFGAAIGVGGSTPILSNGIPSVQTSISSTHIHIPLVLAALGPLALASLYMHWMRISGQRHTKAVLASSSSSGSLNDFEHGKVSLQDDNHLTSTGTKSSSSSRLRAYSGSQNGIDKSQLMGSVDYRNIQQRLVAREDASDHLPIFNSLTATTMLSTPCILKVSFETFRKVRPPPQLKAALAVMSGMTHPFAIATSAGHSSVPGLRNSLLGTDSNSSSALRYAGSHVTQAKSVGSFPSPVDPMNANPSKPNPQTMHPQTSLAASRASLSASVSGSGSGSTIPQRGMLLDSPSINTSITTPDEVLSRAALVVTALELHPGPQLSSAGDLYKKLSALRIRLTEIRKNVTTFLQGAGSLLLRRYATPATASLLVCLFDVDAYAGLLRLSGAQLTSRTKTVKELVLMLQALPPPAQPTPIAEKRKNKNSTSRSSGMQSETHVDHSPEGSTVSTEPRGSLSVNSQSFGGPMTSTSEDGPNSQRDSKTISVTGVNPDTEDDSHEDGDNQNERTSYNSEEDVHNEDPQGPNPPAFGLFTRPSDDDYNPLYALRAARERRAMIALRDEILSHREDLLQDIAQDEALVERALTNPNPSK